MMTEWRVGQEVTVVGGFQGIPTNLRTVSEVAKRKVTLDDGSEWRARDGRQWGDTDIWLRGPRIRERQPDDQDTIDRARYTNYLTKNGIWDRLPLLLLREIAERVSAARALAKKKE